MKILVLGNSNDTGSFVPEEAKRHTKLRDMLAAEFGEPVEVAVRNVWPNERMVDYVARAVEDLEPDLVYVNVTSYPFTYESTPLRVKRIFGKVGGERLGDAGLRMADSRKWSHNAVFRGVRRFAQATIGGDTHFMPERVAERYERLVRALLQREGMLVVVKGPRGKTKGVTARTRARAEVRRQVVHRRLEQLCQQLHLTYEGSARPLYEMAPAPKGTKVGDGMHSNATGHDLSANQQFEFLREAWRERLHGTGGRA
ncbi:MAG: SGNH/GDSL hydrolase family protein [Dehalococcoidia bacterium]|nr:SGNH/GDSL hydrolase family protein [Dehalococcoidia bacterium]